MRSLKKKKEMPLQAQLKKKKTRNQLYNKGAHHITRLSRKKKSEAFVLYTGQQTSVNDIL